MNNVISYNECTTISLDKIVNVDLFEKIKTRLVADILSSVAKNYISQFPLEHWSQLIKDLKTDIEVVVDENLIIASKELRGI